MAYFTSIERTLNKALTDAAIDPLQIVLVTPVMGDESYVLDSAVCESENSLTLRYGSGGTKKRKKVEKNGYELTIVKGEAQVTASKDRIKFVSEGEPGIVLFGDRGSVMKKMEALNRRSVLRYRDDD
ncbi:hypothetical protein [Nevskia ramosa]|uniref:hypothetical protein n=1 Tax=Nevskia ramosa TaxID=64002 RepID=UPI002352552E|nr:hypothetical protein [Nevskia ramosa]